MESRQLGGTGVDVSRIILGCGNFGGIGSAPEFFGKGENAPKRFVLGEVSEGSAAGALTLEVEASEAK